MAHILVIEDEPGVQMALQDSLESEGHAVKIAGDGSAGLNLALKQNGGERFDLILLDLMLPKMNGLEVCQQLRAENIATPIIMLTARGEPSDAAFGLKLGADDYIPKPFDVGELLARIEAVLRRSKNLQTEERTAVIGNIKFDFLRLKATCDGRNLDFTPREFEILQLLVTNAGETVTREQILNHIWGEHASHFTRTIDAHITRLRHKIEKNPSKPENIVTVHGIGYRLITD